MHFSIMKPFTIDIRPRHPTQPYLGRLHEQKVLRHYLEVLFCVKAQNSKLFSCKPGSRPLFGILMVGPQDCVKKIVAIRTKAPFYGSPRSFVLCYFSNLGTDPFPYILMCLQGFGAVLNQKVASNQKFRFLGHLQVLFHTKHQNSPPLFIKAGNIHLPGMLTSLQSVGAASKKKLPFSKYQGLWVTFKFCILQNLHISHFYLAIMETAPFSWYFD